MSLYDDILKCLNPSQAPSPFPDVDEHYLTLVEEQRAHHQELVDKQRVQQYQTLLAQQHPNILAGLMGQPIGSTGYGVGGSLTRNGLGYAKPFEPPSLPESTVISAVAGWRRWSVTMFGSLLFSNNGTPWEPFQRLAADCDQRQNCRGIDCGCGIYAYKTRDLAENGLNAPSAITHVWGEVWLWGRIIECEHGFRAQFAYPKVIVDTGSIAQQVAIVYGIPVIPKR